jgi:hypothetical protein
MGRVHKVFLDPQSVKETKDEKFIGHSFDLVIQVEAPDECQLRWWERTDVPYIQREVNYKEGFVVKEGMIPEVWANMTNICPDSAIFKPWNDEQKKGSKDFTTITLTDIPAIQIPENGYKSRRLDFRLIVEGTDGSERAVEARQKINIENGKMHVSFRIFANDRPTMASQFVFIDPPTHSPQPRL